MAISKSEKTAAIVIGALVVLVVAAVGFSYIGTPATTPGPSAQQAQPADSAATKTQ
jgi:hypothetical protein